MNFALNDVFVNKISSIVAFRQKNIAFKQYVIYLYYTPIINENKLFIIDFFYFTHLLKSNFNYINPYP